jgi:uncharacterized low-complexity protein
MGTTKSKLKLAALFSVIVFAGTAAILLVNNERSVQQDFSSPELVTEFSSEQMELHKGYSRANNTQESQIAQEFIELKCGDGKSKEAKCGDGKCGDDKSTEDKCGDGKCGDDKSRDNKCGAENKEDKAETTSESKTDESSSMESEEGNNENNE